MIQFDNFAFASPPRTGTAWFVNACAVAGFGEKDRSKVHIPPPAKWGGFMLSIVRHPADWLVSYFNTLEGGKVGVPEVDALAQYYCANDMARSLKRYLKSPPNTVSKMFAAYEATSVMKLEDFPWAPLEFFYSLGYKEKDNRIRSMARMNVKYGVGFVVSYPLRKKIIEHEPMMCEQYDYVI